MTTSRSGLDLEAVLRDDAKPATGRYLLAIYTLSMEHPDRVSTGSLGEELGVSAASVTQMIEKLDDLGLADHEKYAGVRLTDRGEQLARQLARRLCVVKTFFGSELDMSLGEVESFEIGFALPDEGVDRLREMAGGTCVEWCPDTNHSCNGCAT